MIQDEEELPEEADTIGNANHAEAGPSSRPGPSVNKPAEKQKRRAPVKGRGKVKVEEVKWPRYYSVVDRPDAEGELNEDNFVPNPICELTYEDLVLIRKKWEIPDERKCNEYSDMLANILD